MIWVAVSPGGGAAIPYAAHGLLAMTLTEGSRSILTPPFDSSNIVSYLCLIHSICLTQPIKVLQAKQCYSNVFLMKHYMTYVDLA